MYVSGVFASATYFAFDMMQPSFFISPLTHKDTNKGIASDKSPQELLAYFDEQALAGQDYGQVLQHIQGYDRSGLMLKMIADFATQKGITLEQAWAVFLDCLMDRLVHTYMPSRQAKRLLRFQSKAVTQECYAALHATLNSRLPSVSVNAWQ